MSPHDPGANPPGRSAESRVGALHGLLERVRRNAREPRPSFLDFWDRPVGMKRPSRPRPQRPKDPPREDLLAPIEAAPPPTLPPPTAPGRDREALLTFGDESTQTGDPVEAERLILLEQEAARQAEPEPPPTPRSPAPPPVLPRLAPPPPVPPAAASAPALEVQEDEVGLVIDDFDLAGPATQPPAAGPAMPDIEAIENDALDIPEPFLHADPRATLTNEAALERARAESIRPSDRQPPKESERADLDDEIDVEVESLRSVAIRPSDGAASPPPAPVSTVVATPEPRAGGAMLDDDDDVPSSVRKPVQLDRPVDDAFDGFGRVSPASEPPPESGEVPSQRRLLTPPAMNAVSDPEYASSPERDLAASAEREAAPAIQSLGAGLPRLGADDDEDDELSGATKLFRKSERPFADEPSGVTDASSRIAEAARDASAEASEDDVEDLDDEDDDLGDDEPAHAEDGEYEATKEIRTMGRVDVIERQALAAAEVVMLSEPRQKAPATFGELLDLALSIGR